MKGWIFIIGFALLYHVCTKFYGLYKRKKYIILLYKYFSRLVFLYVNDNRKYNKEADEFDNEFWSLRYKLSDRMDFWIKTHNMDYYIWKYPRSWQSIDNPLVPGVGYAQERGVSADILILHILKECSNIDFEPYIEKATDKKCRYPGEKEERWYEPLLLIFSEWSDGGKVYFDVCIAGLILFIIAELYLFIKTGHFSMPPSYQD